MNQQHQQLEQMIKTADLANNARASIEALLVGLGWRWDEALSRAIDRCVELEERGVDVRR